MFRFLTGLHSPHSLTPSHHAPPPHLSAHPSHGSSGSAGSMTPSAGIESARISTDSRRPNDHFDTHGGYGAASSDRHTPSHTPSMPPSNSQQYQSPPSVNSYMSGSGSTHTPSPINNHHQQQHTPHPHPQQQSPMNRSESPVISPQSMLLVYSPNLFNFSRSAQSFVGKDFRANF